MLIEYKSCCIFWVQKNAGAAQLALKDILLSLGALGVRLGAGHWLETKQCAKNALRVTMQETRSTSPNARLAGLENGVIL